MAEAVTGKHGIVFQPPITWAQWEATGKDVYCDPEQARRWQESAAREAHEKRYGKGSADAPKRAISGDHQQIEMQLTLRRNKRGINDLESR